MVELCHSRRIIKEEKANVVDIVWKTAFIQDDLAVPPGTTILIGSELVSWFSNILGKEVFYTPLAIELSARKILESDFPRLHRLLAGSFSLRHYKPTKRRNGQ